MYVNKISLSNNNIAYRSKTSEVLKEVTKKKELVKPKQPLTIPNDIQKFAKRISDFIIRIMDTF